MHRSVTMPARAAEQTTPRRSSIIPTPEPQVETLFKHRSVRIISFMTTPVSSNKHDSKHVPGLEDEIVGTLSWTSPSERLIAVGPLSIYKAPGSVAFLSCVKVMHPILPKSQCWCVDDSSSNFVLQIRRPQYWRIEVPTASLEDQKASEGLRDVLSQVLLFERTPCPFKRSFVVELPEVPATPIKRRPWKPVLVPKSEVEKTDVVLVPPEAEDGEECCSVASDGSVENQRMNSDSDATDDTNATPRNTFHRSLEPSVNIQDVTRNSAAPSTYRSVTAPPQLTVITSPSSRNDSNISILGKNSGLESASSDYSSSVESFHTVQSWHSPITPLPPSPPESHPSSPTTYPYPHDNISLPKRFVHTRDISEVTITPESPRVWEITRNSSTESVNEVEERFSTPPPTTATKYNEIAENLNGEHFEVAPSLGQQQQIRHRPTTGSNSRRRALSPLPSAANIFSPSRRRPRRLQTSRHLPTAIIQKTYEILLSPPSHLLHLMLNIAAKIAAGEWRGTVFGFGEGGEKVVSQWDYEDGEMSGDSWDVDDYGVSLGGKQSSKSGSNQERVGRSWEVD